MTLTDVSTAATASLLDQIIEHCRNAKFTGTLKLRTQQGEGELWFLSGMRDDARFGVSRGDEAMDRMGRATNPTFELIPRLPPLSGGKKSYPTEGSLGAERPVDLFRFCETNALTCTLVLKRANVAARARYQLGELLGVESDSADAAAIAQMLEWTEGDYEFQLPPLELPPGVPVYTPPPAQVMPKLSESVRPPPAVDDSARRAEEQRKADAEAAKRRADDEARKKLEAEAQQRKADEEAARRKADEEAARRKADEEAARRREEARRAEAEAARRKAEEEAARRRTEAEAAARKAEEEAEAQRKADEEARRKAVAVHRQISIGTSSKVSEPPRPRATSEAPPASPAQTEDDRAAAIAEAWRRAEEQAEAKLRESGRPAPPEPEVPGEAEAAREAAARAEAERKAEQEAEAQREAEQAAEAAREAEADAKRKAEQKAAAAEARPVQRKRPAEVAEEPEAELAAAVGRRSGPPWTAIVIVLIVLAAIGALVLSSR